MFVTQVRHTGRGDGVDLGFLRPLYENPRDWPASGYVSVYLDAAPKENAPNEVALRLRAAREALAAAGADQATLDAVLAANLDHVPARSHALFAAGGLLRLHGIMPESPSLGESSSYTPLPHVVPWLAQRPPRPHQAPGRVDAGHLGDDELDVPVLPEQLAQRHRDLPLGQDAGRALVQQRLEQVMLGAVEQGHLDRRPAERPHREQPGEPAAHDYHPASPGSLGHGSPLPTRPPRCWP